VAILIHPKRWATGALLGTCPPLSATLDFGHPLAKDMRICVLLGPPVGLPPVGSDSSLPISVTNLANLSTLVQFRIHGVSETSPRWLVDNDGYGFSPGSGQEVLNLGNDASLNPSVTITVMARAGMSDAGSGNVRLFGKEVSGGPSINWSIFKDNGTQKVFCGISSGGTQHSFLQPSVITAKTANTHAFTYDGANLIGYLNGHQDSTNAQAGAIDGGTGLVCVGGSPFSDSDWQVGSGNIAIYFAYMWARPLSAMEIEWLQVEPYAMISAPSPRIRYFVGPLAPVDQFQPSAAGTFQPAGSGATNQPAGVIN